MGTVGGGSTVVGGGAVVEVVSEVVVDDEVEEDVVVVPSRFSGGAGKSAGSRLATAAVMNRCQISAGNEPPVTVRP